MLKPETVRKRREYIDTAWFKEQCEFEKKRVAKDKLLTELQKKCGHENMNSAAYSRWCEDCGKEWSTS